MKVMGLLKKYHLLCLMAALILCLPLYSHAQQSNDKEFDEILNQELNDKSSAPTQTQTQTETQTEPQPPADQQTTQQQPRIPPRVEYIHHPQAKVGLIRITEDGTYIYRVKRPSGRRTATLSFAIMSPLNISNPAINNTSYADMYGHSSGGLMGSYEFQLYRGLGKLGLKLQTGLITATGNGRFEQTQGAPYNTNIAMEGFTFYTFPNNVALIYRAQFWDRQPLIPYGEAGGDYYAMIEDRSDTKPAHYGLAPATHLAAGLAFNLTWIGGEGVSRLAQEYGISGFYIYGEYRQVIGLSSSLNVTSQITSGGIMADF